MDGKVDGKTEEIDPKFKKDEELPGSLQHAKDICSNLEQYQRGASDTPPGMESLSPGGPGVFPGKKPERMGPDKVREEKEKYF